MDEVDPRALLEAGEEERRDLARCPPQLVPPDVRRPGPGGKRGHPPLQEAEPPRRAELLALLVQQLVAEAEAQETPAPFHRRPEGRVEAQLDEPLHRRGEGADAGEDDARGGGDPLGVLRQLHAGPEPLEAAPHRRYVADPVVDDDDAVHAVRLPFVERTVLPVTATACRRARAADLKTASAA